MIELLILPLLLIVAVWLGASMMRRALRKLIEDGPDGALSRDAVLAILDMVTPALLWAFALGKLRGRP